MLPPNTLAADTEINTGKNTNAVFAIKSKMLNQSLEPNEGIAFANASTRPIIRPDATIAGKIGTKTSPRDLIIL